jgi:hypothetical protein
VLATDHRKYSLPFFPRYLEEEELEKLLEIFDPKRERGNKKRGEGKRKSPSP